MAESEYQMLEEFMHMRRLSVFNDYAFYTANQCRQAIADIPHEPYGKLPSHVDTKMTKKRRGALREQSSRAATAKEQAHMSPNAKILNLAENEKVEKVVSYLKAIWNREMVPTNTSDGMVNNCMMEAVLSQIGNKDWMADKDGIMYTETDLRHQTVYHMATQYETMYPKIMLRLEMSYKEWLLSMLDDSEEGDLALFVGMGDLLKIPMVILYPKTFAYDNEKRSDEQKNKKSKKRERESDSANIEVDEEDNEEKRRPCISMFANNDHIGKDPKTEIPIVLIYNGYDHFVGSKLPGIPFNHGVDTIIGHAHAIRAVQNKLINAVSDKELKHKLSRGLEYLADTNYMLLKHVNPTLPIEKTTEEKRNVENIKEDIKLTRQIDFSMTSLHCACGKKKGSEDALLRHIENRHANNNWACSYEDCDTVCRSKSAMKKHVRRQHYKEYIYYCKYCDFGRDEEWLVLSHVGNKHGNGQTFPCSKENCKSKAKFWSQKQLADHEAFCGIGTKLYKCTLCSASYKRKRGLQHHTKQAHSNNPTEFKCVICERKYKSETALKKHYKDKQGLCRKVVELNEKQEKEIIKDDNDESVLQTDDTTIEALQKLVDIIDYGAGGDNVGDLIMEVVDFDPNATIEGVDLYAPLPGLEEEDEFEYIAKALHGENDSAGTTEVVDAQSLPEAEDEPEHIVNDSSGENESDNSEHIEKSVNSDNHADGITEAINPNTPLQVINAEDDLDHIENDSNGNKDGVDRNMPLKCIEALNETEVTENDL